MRKIKAASAALIGIALMSAVGVSAAQAGTLHIGANPAVITGQSAGEPIASTTLTLTSTKGEKFNSICTNSTFEGTVHQGTAPQTPVPQTVHDVTVTPTYSSCTAFGVAAQVLMNGCEYTLTGQGHPAHTATVDIVDCTPEKQIEIKTAICTLKIPAQNNLSHVVATTGADTPVPDITLDATVSEITVTQSGAACPDGNNHHSKNASFVGQTTTRAFVDEGKVTVQKHGHHYFEYLEGAQVSLTST